MEILCLRLNKKFSCRLVGDGEIVAIDNGDATCLIPFSETFRPAFNGLMLAIIKTKPHPVGKLKLIAESQGLEKGENVINVAGQ